MNATLETSTNKFVCVCVKLSIAKECNGQFEATLVELKKCPATKATLRLPCALLCVSISLAMEEVEWCSSDSVVSMQIRLVSAIEIACGEPNGISFELH